MGLSAGIGRSLTDPFDVARCYVTYHTATGNPTEGSSSLTPTAEAGEAAKALPDDVTAAIPDVPWSEIVKARDFYMHHYGDIDPEVLWDTLEQSLPPLGAAIDRYLRG